MAEAGLLSTSLLLLHSNCETKWLNLNHPRCLSFLQTGKSGSEGLDVLRLLGASPVGGCHGSAGGPGGSSEWGTRALCCPKCTCTSAALWSGGSPARVPWWDGGKAPPAPLLLLQGPTVAQYLQQEYGDGVVLRKWCVCVSPGHLHSHVFPPLEEWGSELWGGLALKELCSGRCLGSTDTHVGCDPQG